MKSIDLIIKYYKTSGLEIPQPIQELIGEIDKLSPCEHKGYRQKIERYRGKNDMEEKINIEELQQMWKGFGRYALDNGINLDQEDDFVDWWDCYITGYLRCDDMINETCYLPEYNSKVMLDELQKALKEGE